ncbi:MAG: SDR family NAD(P)-dependent oxidoreductase [Actinomycetes bacterium]
MRLEGRTAVVTGAGRGIGQQVALVLGRAGAHVVLASRSPDALVQTRARIEADGGTALVVPTDITRQSDVATLAERVEETYGAADVLVCNSGVGGPSAPLWEVDPAEWESTLAVNVTGTFLCCRAILPAMLGRRSGSVVVIGSMTGKRPLMNRSPYATSKTALIGLVRTLAHETGPYGVRVNLVSPGPVEGERIEWVIGRQAEAQGISPEEAREQFTSSSPLRRLVAASDVADAVLYLASDQAGSVTGEDLNVSAGTVMH